MSRFVNVSRHFGWFVCCLLLIWGCSAALAADVLVLKDGSEIKGKLVDVDAHRVLFQHEDGRQEPFPRSRVARIEFGSEPIPLRVRVRVDDADDEVHLFLDGTEIGTPSQLEKGWFDLSPLLQDGPHQLTGEVANKTAFWAYRWVLEAGGQSFAFACGLAHKSGCTTGGRDPREQGTMPAGKAWLFVHRDTGEVRVEVESR